MRFMRRKNKLNKSYKLYQLLPLLAMLIITLQRDKCIGCNYCAELAPEFFRMSKKDGKCNLLHSQEKKGFHTARTSFAHAEEPLDAAAKVCPVKIIKISKV